MLKVSKKFELDELKSVLKKYYNKSEISKIEQVLLENDAWSDGHIVILSVTIESAQYYDKFRVVAPETYEAFF